MAEWLVLAKGRRSKITEKNFKDGDFMVSVAHYKSGQLMYKEATNMVNLMVFVKTIMATDSLNKLLKEFLITLTINTLDMRLQKRGLEWTF